MDLALAAPWVWHARSPAAALVRLALLPAAGLYRLAVAARNASYDAGLLGSAALPAPAIGVGNISVGGTGKTPLAAWLAGELGRRGVRAGIVLRGYGADEVVEYAAAAPGAIVEASADRHGAAATAVERGAGALVLDDCLQRRDVRVDLMLAVVAAETWAGRRWPLPAGPWREGIAALGRADAVVVTRKAASPERAGELAGRLARHTRQRTAVVADLHLLQLRPLAGGESRPLEALAGRDVLAVCGIGAPEAFLAQLARTGARARLRAYGDHHPYSRSDIAAIIRGLGADTLVVTTAKDAVKLAPLWPADGPPCLVALLGVTVSTGAEALGVLLDRVATAAPGHLPHATAASPMRTP